MPELDRSNDPDFASAPYPALVPLGPVLAGKVDPAEEVATEEAAMAARIAALRARAQRLSNQPVIDADTKTRLTEAAGS